MSQITSPNEYNSFSRKTREDSLNETRFDKSCHESYFIASLSLRNAFIKFEKNCSCVKNEAVPDKLLWSIFDEHSALGHKERKSQTEFRFFRKSLPRLQGNLAVSVTKSAFKIRF